MTISNYKVVGGTLKATSLKSTLSERDYDIVKAYVWLEMLKNHQKPTMWYKPSKTGTSVKFDYLQSQQDADIAVAELQGYVKVVNVKYPEVGLTYESSNAMSV